MNEDQRPGAEPGPANESPAPFSRQWRERLEVAAPSPAPEVVPPPEALEEPHRAAPRPRLAGCSGLLRDLFSRPQFAAEREVAPLNRAEGFLPPLLLIVTILFFLTGLISLGLALLPTWDTSLLLPLAAVTALASYLYSRRLASGTILPKEWLVLLLPVILLARLAPYVNLGFARLTADVVQWWRAPLSFFDGDFVASSLLLVLAWAVSFVSTQDLNRLRLQRGELPPPTDSPAYYLWLTGGGRQVDHTTPLKSLAGRFLLGGVLLLFCSALAAIGVRQLLSAPALLELVTFRRPTLTAVYLNVLLYFLCGLLLLSHGQLTRLRTLWQVEETEVSPLVGRRWAPVVGGFLLLVLCLALLLPTAYSLTLADVVLTLLGLLMFVGSFFLQLFFLLFALLLSSLLSLFRQTPPTPSPALPPQPLLPDAQAWTLPAGLEVVKSLFFWVFVLGIIGYSVYTLLAHRQGRVATWAAGGFLARLRAWLQALLSLWRYLGGATRRAVRAATSAVATRLGRRAGAMPPRPGWLSLRRLGPRELILYFYLSILERAGRLGYRRGPGQTPQEYSQAFQARLPEVQDDLWPLTAAFQEARYSRHDIGPQHASPARQHWQRLKAALQRRWRAGRS